MTHARRWPLAACAVLLVLTLVAAAVPAQEPVKVRIGNLGFPSHAAMILGVLKAKNFDTKHGVDMEVKPYGAVGAYYGAAASGETDGVGGGPLVFQKMRLE